jgi:hypothetical protein
MSIVENIEDLVKLAQQSNNSELLKKAKIIQSEVLDLTEKLKKIQEALGSKGKVESGHKKIGIAHLGGHRKIDLSL